MNFVRLVDSLRVEAGVSGRSLTTLQGALPAEISRLKGWIADSWNVIQADREDWFFQEREGNCVVPQGLVVVEPPELVAGEVGTWKPCRFELGEVGDDFSRARPVEYVEWQDWRSTGAKAVDPFGTPRMFTVRPRDLAVVLSPGTDRDYRLWYEYARAPFTLEQDDDTPMLPEKYHRVIVWKALIEYGMIENAPEAVERGRVNYSRLMNQMVHDQL